MPTLKKTPLHHYHNSSYQAKENPQQNQQASAEILAKSWAVQYGEMHSEQKVIARKLISDILFHGCLGNLDMSHAMEIQNILHNESARNYHHPYNMDSQGAMEQSEPNIEYVQLEDIDENCFMSSEN